MKRPEDLKLVKKSSEVLRYFYGKMLEHVENSIDEGTNISHFKISEDMEKIIDTDKASYTEKFGIKPEFFDLSYTPIVQSGGEYDLRPTAVSNKSPLKPDCILLSIGSKYFEYNTNVVRTLFINASKDEENAYKICYEAHEKLISLLRPGAVIKEVHDQIREFILAKNGEYADNLPSNFGFGIGLEFRESVLLINPKNERTVKPNMVFNALVSLKDLKTSTGKKYAIKIVDTVLVKQNENVVLTDKIDKNYSDVGYNIEDLDDEEEPEPKIDKRKEFLKQMENRGAMPLTRSKRRGGANKMEEHTAQKIAQHQSELLDAKCKELQDRLEKGDYVQNQSTKNQI